MEKKLVRKADFLSGSALGGLPKLAGQEGTPMYAPMAPKPVVRAPERPARAPPHKHAYKFTRKEFLERLLKYDEIRMGTIEEYRQPDGLVGGLSDEKEDTTDWELIKGIDYHIGPHTALGKAFGLEEIPWGVTIRSAVDTATVNLQGPPYFIFSMSADIDADLVEKMRTMFGYDACYKIKDHGQFTWKIHSHDLFNKLEGGLGMVEYGPMVVSDDGRIPEEFSHVLYKREEYAWQNELRIGFQKDEEPTTGVIVRIPGLRDMVEEVDLGTLQVLKSPT